MMTAPDVIAKLTLYPVEQGGRKSATPSDYLGCIFEFEGEYFDCRLLLGDFGPLLPGTRATVPIKFLSPELVRERLQNGSRFILREVEPIGEGVVQEISTLDSC